jgi:mannose-1-phosphate guanylyltransferase
MTNPTNTYVAIMAGGIGSRFWPASREGRPKQFLDIMGVGKSLLRLTFERFIRLCPAKNIYILTNAAYKAQVLEQLPELTDEQVLCEPSRNNTAPCVAYTAFKLHALNPAANFVVAPSDHIILKEDVFLEKIKAALTFTEQNDALLTLGITPTRPDTGYGYIKFEDKGKLVHKVLEFREKPDLDTAKLYYASGSYVWNAGIFVWKAANILKSFQKHSPDIFNILKNIDNQYNTPSEQAAIDIAYPTCPSISIDYAIMEKADNVFTIPADFGWSDLGTWASLFAESEKDAHGNAINGDKVLALDTRNCLVRAPKGKLVVLKDLQDYIVVDEGDVLLVYPKSKEQEVKGVVGRLGKEQPEFV